MKNLKVCFYNSGSGRPYKRGTILRHIADALKKRGVFCVYGDDEVEPDVYIFEKFCQCVYRYGILAFPLIRWRWSHTRDSTQRCQRITKIRIA